MEKTQDGKTPKGKTALEKEFEKRFAGFLGELAAMEKGKRGQESRDLFWKRYQMDGTGEFQNEFSAMLLKIIDQKKNSWSTWEQGGEGISSKISSKYGLEAYEALRYSIYQYDGSSSFIAIMLRRFKQLWSKENIVKKSEEMISGRGLDRSEMSRYYIGKLLNDISKEKAGNPVNEVWDLIHSQLDDGKRFGHVYSRDELKIVYEIYVAGPDLSNESIENDEEEFPESISDQLYGMGRSSGKDDSAYGAWSQSAENVYLSNEQTFSVSDIFGIFCRVLADNDVLQAFPKEKRDYIKLFITRRLLTALKLQYRSEQDMEMMKQKYPEDYERLKELYERKLPVLRGMNKTEQAGGAGYYRYPEKPAGDTEMYENLEGHENDLYRRVLHADYLKCAIDGDASVLYSVYKEYLKKDFLFTNHVMAQIKGCGDSAITKQNDRFEEKVLPFLADKYREIKSALYENMQRLSP